MPIAEILQALIASVEGMNPTKLSKETGVPQPTIRRILVGESLDPDTATLKPIADRFGKTVAQLRGEIPLEVVGVVDPSAPVTRLPLVSLVQAGLPAELFDPYIPGVAERWEPFAGKYSASAYCVMVKGHSMQAPEGQTPTFPEGTIIAVEPTRAAIHKDFVIVRFVNNDEATFKQLILDGPFKFLKPLNPDYKTMPVPEGAQLCGVVREARLTQKFY